MASYTTANPGDGRFQDDNPSEGDWLLVGEGNLRGATLVVHRGSKEAVSLSTRSCREEDRWEQIPDLSNYPSLEVLDLHKSRYIKEFDASVCKAPKLRRLLLTRCDRLCTIAPSIGAFHNLTELNLFDSPKIKALPDEIGQLTNLKKIIFGGSNGVANKALESLPDSLGQLVSLEELVLDHCKALRALPNTIGNLKNLTTLHMRACKNVTELPDSIGDCSHLIDVSLVKCKSLKCLPESIKNWAELEDLNLSKCQTLTGLPTGIAGCKKLAFLSLRSCSKLESLPSTLEELPRLRTLDLAMCDKLKMVPTWLVGVSWRMDPLDLSQRVKALEVSEEADMEE